jgi:hypothetical protein
LYYYHPDDGRLASNTMDQTWCTVGNPLRCLLGCYYHYHPVPMVYSTVTMPVVHAPTKAGLLLDARTRAGREWLANLGCVWCGTVVVVHCCSLIIFLASTTQVVLFLSLLSSVGSCNWARLVTSAEGTGVSKITRDAKKAVWCTNIHAKKRASGVGVAGFCACLSP